MTRIKRSHLSTHTNFHVCSHGNDSQKLFLDDKDRIRYLSLVEKYFSQRKVRCFAYCLMTNHIHLLIQTPTIFILTKVMHAIHVSYVMYFNRRYNRRGHLFRDRFSSWVIKNDAHLMNTKEYIEYNPIKAKMVAKVADYRWSSASGAGSIVTLYPVTK